jgi:hypothetical protein
LVFICCTWNPLASTPTDPGTRETRVQDMRPPALVRALAGTATWERSDGCAEDWVRIDPPARHAGRWHE